MAAPVKLAWVFHKYRNNRWGNVGWRERFNDLERRAVGWTVHWSGSFRAKYPPITTTSESRISVREEALWISGAHKSSYRVDRYSARKWALDCIHRPAEKRGRSTVLASRNSQNHRCSRQDGPEIIPSESHPEWASHGDDSRHEYSRVRASTCHCLDHYILPAQQ